MSGYGEGIEQRMKAFFRSLKEKDRRRYAAIEAEKLGHGGTEYIAELFGIDPKTVRRGGADLKLPEDSAPERERKKGVDANPSSS